MITLFESFEEKTAVPARMQTLELADILPAIERICPGYDPNDTAKWPRIFRGGRNFKDDAALCNPAFSQRNSANADNNLYNLLLDAFPAYPPRLRSLITSSRAGYAAGFGSKVYVVVPAAGAPVGVCPKGDMWESYDFKRFDLGGVSSLSSLFYSLFEAAGANNKFTTTEEMKHSLEQLKQHVKSTGVDAIVEKLSWLRVRITTMLEYLSDYPSYYEGLTSLLDPEKNGFDRFAYGDGRWQPTFEGGHEMWLSEQCVLVRKAVFEQLYEITLD